MLRGRFSPIPSPASFSTRTSNKLVLILLAVAFAGCYSVAQSSSPAAGDNQTGSASAPHDQKSNIVVPAGTSIPLALTHPIRSRSIRRGDDIYAQITSPISTDSEVVFPPGTFIEGKVDKLERKSSRGEIRLQSLSVTFPNGYVVPVVGPVTVESADGYAVIDPVNGRAITAVALPLAGAGMGALIGHATASSQPTTIASSVPPGCTGPPPGCLTSSLSVPPDKGKNTVIGAAIGGAIGGVTSLVLLTRTHHFYLDVGSPAQMVLQQPLSLERDQVAEAMALAQARPVQSAVPPPSTNTSAAKDPFDCSAGQEFCGGRCVDTITFMNDSNNCGRCGNHCSISEACTGGSCSCGPAYTTCMGSCVSQASFMSDSSNCGRCGNQCSIGETCMGGSCMRTTPCPKGDITCH